MIKLRERSVGGISRKASNRHFLVWLTSDNDKNITVWGTGKCWRRDPHSSKLFCTARAGLPETTHVLCPLLHAFFFFFFNTKKQTAPALHEIFSGDLLQMLHFSVTLYPTLSLLNLSAVKL